MDYGMQTRYIYVFDLLYKLISMHFTKIVQINHTDYKYEQNHVSKPIKTIKNIIVMATY